MLLVMLAPVDVAVLIATTIQHQDIHQTPQDIVVLLEEVVFQTIPLAQLQAEAATLQQHLAIIQQVL